METDVGAILYFSATSSCKMIAEFFSDKCNAIIINLTDVNERQNFFVSGNCLFILPVYNGAIPAVCADYINRLDGMGRHAHIICVYGGVYRGKALQNAAGLLKSCGFIPMRGAYVAAPHTYYKKKINLIDDMQLNIIHQNLFNINAGKTLKIAENPKGWEKQTVLKKFTGKCVVNSSCNNCGQCKIVCPVNAIDSDYKSNKNCILCGSCVKICARNARRIRFFTPIPAIFIKIKCKPREDQFFTFF